MLTIFSIYEANGQPVLGRGAEVELRGTLGTVYAATDRLRDRRRARRCVPGSRSRAARVRSSKRPTATSTSKPPATSSTASRAAGAPTPTSRKGHRSTTFAHLANIALATRKRLDWDPQAERFTNCDAANELLHYEYRKPWSLA